MSSKQRILHEIETYDTGKLSLFLEANGFEEFTQIVQIKEVDGSHFLGIKEYEVLSWKPHINLQQVRKFWAFVTHFKENPEKYVLPIQKFPRPNITRQQLANLCNDDQVINKLHDLLQEREREQQMTIHQDSFDNQDSFSSEDETYVNHDAVVNYTPNKSNLHKMCFKDPTKELKPQLSQSSDTDSDERFENAYKTQAKQNSVKEVHIPTPIIMEDETDEIYENRPMARAKKGIGIPILPTPSYIPKTMKTEEPKNPKCNIGSQVLPRPPFPTSSKPYKEPNSKKEAALTPTKLKPLPPIPQNEQTQPPMPPRSFKTDQTVSPITPTKNTCQFLDARSHLASVLTGKLSPKKDEGLEEYLEPNHNEEEEVYEPEPKFQEDKAKNKLTALGAIQGLPLPPLPVRVDLKTSEVSPKNRGGKEIQSRALPKPPQHDFEQVPQANTLPRPPRKFPNSNATQETELECYRSIDRVESELLLTEDLGDGAYLFRPSKQYFSTLSVRCENKIYHIGIKQNTDGQLECLSSGRHLLFDNLKQICEHFKANPLRMIDNFNNYKSIKLRDVLPKERT